jgi:hypothetical protein
MARILIVATGLYGTVINTISIIILTIAVTRLHRIIKSNEMLKESHKMMRYHFIFITASQLIFIF